MFKAIMIEKFKYMIYMVSLKEVYNTEKIQMDGIIWI